MAQFDVYELRSEPRLVVDVQSDLISRQLDSRLVIPLFDPETANWPFQRLTPLLEIDGKPHLLATPLMIGMPKQELKRLPVASLASESYRILNAIDFLLSGV
jgi:toxin CcdB